MAAPDLLLIGCNTANIIRVSLNKVGIEIVECAAHLVCMFLIHAEDDRLGEAIRLLKEVSKMAGNSLGPSTQGNYALEVFCPVLPVGNFPAVPVQVALAGTPTGGVPFGYDPVDAVRCQEAILYALPQAVLVDRVAEVTVCGSVVLAQRSCRHA